MQSIHERPLHVEEKQMVKNVASSYKTDCEIKLSITSGNSFQANSEISNQVKTQKSSLVKSKKFEKKDKNKAKKKRVRFVEAESDPEKVSFRERFVQFFHYIWNCTRTTVEIVLSKFQRFFNARCLFSEY